jgi:hypothetical protein
MPEAEFAVTCRAETRAMPSCTSLSRMMHSASSTPNVEKSKMREVFFGGNEYASDEETFTL